VKERRKRKKEKEKEKKKKRKELDRPKSQVPPPRQITVPITIFKLRQNGGFKSNGREGGGQ
jgi:hypothetical protein